MTLMVDDVLDFLADEGLIGGATGWTAAYGHLPPTPDQVIVVFETPGLPPEKAQTGSSETEYDEPGFQIRGRGAEYGMEALRTLMGQIYRALHGSSLSPATGDPAYVFVFAEQSGPLTLGLDDASRPGLTWNFRCMRERETA